MAKFEAAVIYDGSHQAVLETYADSMGWTVELVMGEFCLCKLSREDTKAEYSLQDLESAVGFFNNEDVHPLSWRIVRVIYDSAGYDEITDIEDSELG